MIGPLVGLKRMLGRILFWAASVLLIAMTFLVMYQVFTRYVLDEPAAFTEELVRYTLVWTGFIGAAYAFLTRGHMSLTILRDAIPGTAGVVVRVAIHAVVLLFAVIVLVIGGANLSFTSWGVESALLQIPRGLIYLAAPVAGLFICAAQVIAILEEITGRRSTVPGEDLAEENEEVTAS
ncbi:MAG: TRAP transporter small permease [Brachybacterium sp.]|nr:TRAP transporter small permease [Brachybacterium sp.]